MKYLFVYESGNVPEDKQEENVKALYAWLDKLSADGIIQSTVATQGGKTVSKDGIDEYKGRIFGVSVVVAESLDDAVSKTSDWPELSYGGQLHILEELGD